MSTELLLIILSSLVILSYLFSVVSRFVKVPSVLLLLFAGIGFRLLADSTGVVVSIPPTVVEGLGVTGLIMIVLEAGLDLPVEKRKLPLIRRAFFSALVILVLSAASIAVLLMIWLHEDFTRCLVYALPLSIMSSSIVLPSIHHLTPAKKEFLIYEASFSDIIGIVVFNYFAAKEILTLKSVGVFGLNIVISVALSVVLSVLLFLLLVRATLNIKFFLVFALLILIYSGGKLLHLPSLLIILVFGMLIANWEKIPFLARQRLFVTAPVKEIRESLHAITAESSFLVRTFFFILFGYTINLAFLKDTRVVLIGLSVVLLLFVIRYVYLRFSFRTSPFPEAFFIPRGLITIVLFYKIPSDLRLTSFDEGILFFIILSTGLILTLGMILYKKRNEEVTEDPQFAERKDLL